MFPTGTKTFDDLFSEKIEDTIHTIAMSNHGYATQKCYLYVVSGRQRSKHSGKSTIRVSRSFSLNKEKTYYGIMGCNYGSY